MDEKQEHILSRVKEKILGVYTDIIAIYFFGSFGTKYERNDSDVDISILSKIPIDSVKLWYFAQEIAAEIKRDVDLIDLGEASTVC
jgi:predicted nucleotidyltransferase